jgi:hypothetical protein
MALQHFADLPAYRQHRIQAGRRLLENHRHPAAPNAPHVGFRQGQQFLAIQLHAAGEHTAGGWQ